MLLTITTMGMAAIALASLVAIESILVLRTLRTTPHLEPFPGSTREVFVYLGAFSITLLALGYFERKTRFMRRVLTWIAKYRYIEDDGGHPCLGKEK
jgi:hypothetical protein